MNMTSAKELLSERDDLDKKIDEQHAILLACGADMKTELVDAEGFPRADLDVYSVRHARAKIIQLNNDRDTLTEKIAQAMTEIHSAADAEMASEDEKRKIVHRTSNDPFVRVSDVAAGSPADLAGLRKDDQIIQFDTLHQGNFREMKELAAVVKENEGKSVNVTVIRNLRPVRLQLTPRRWSSDPKQGTLGCALLPIK